MNINDLKTATAQQVFDYVAAHLLRQRKKSLRTLEGDKNSGQWCAYRGNGATKCAAGCLFEDSQYDPKFEGRSWSSLVYDNVVPGRHSRLIRALQGVHDSVEPKSWRSALAEVAALFNLVY